MKLVVTGGIGCGKSTVIKFLQQLLPDHKVFSVDDLVAKNYEDPETQAELMEAFGTCVKKEISDIVFNNPDQMLKLRAIWAEKITRLVGDALAHDDVILEFPMLYESGNGVPGATVLCLTCDPEIQKERVLSRDGMTEEKLRGILANQLSQELKAALADVVVDTSHSIEYVHTQLEKLIVRDVLRARGDKFFQKHAGCNIPWAIEAAYTQQHRHYHNLNHLYAVFKALDKHGPVHPAVELAVWYHDFVYSVDPKEYRDNEANSVKDMFARFGGVIDPQLLLLAGELIMSTKGHKITSAWVKADPIRLHCNQIFLDADLSILGADDETFCQYDYEIVNEWGQYGNPSLQFITARKNAMRSFLQREQLFFSKEFKHLETRARINLRNLDLQYSNIEQGLTK